MVGDRGDPDRTAGKREPRDQLVGEVSVDDARAPLPPFEPADGPVRDRFGGDPLLAERGGSGDRNGRSVRSSVILTIHTTPDPIGDSERDRCPG